MPRYIGASNTAAIAAGANFTAGNQSKGSLYDFLKSMGGEKGSAHRARQPTGHLMQMHQHKLQLLVEH